MDKQVALLALLLLNHHRSSTHTVSVHYAEVSLASRLWFKLLPALCTQRLEARFLFISEVEEISDALLVAIGAALIH